MTHTTRSPQLGVRRFARAGASILLPAISVACSPSPEPPCSGECTGIRSYDALAYELIGHFDWSASRLVAQERVSLVSTVGTLGTVELDSRVQVKKVYADAVNLGFAADPNGTLRINLAPLRTGSQPAAFTIEYEAPVSVALRASSGRDDDPVTSRVVYTNSEPVDGVYWLPADHRPEDRAAFSVELSVDAGEDVIANGVRTKDTTENGARVVRYEMSDAIPTYTMAFAAGQLEHEDGKAGTLPIALWHRRGLLVDPALLLSRTAEDLATLENLLGPYPWTSYSLVLLPEMTGGMENTTVSFLLEKSGQANANFNVIAHELAHQWFGDWVTPQTFDDLWVKEGMAALLAEEADRSRRDREHRGRLFGYDFGFVPGQAIRDPALKEHAKYNTGPYGRAAWLLTQIRVAVGEQSFWQSLRKALGDHALGSIDSESFLRAFALDAVTFAKALHALDEKRGPSIATNLVSDPSGGSLVTFQITDPGDTLLVPIGIAVVDGRGNATEKSLVPNAPVTVAVPSDGYLAIDERDVHPDWAGAFDSPLDEAIVKLFMPRTLPAVVAFGTRSAAHQERALAYASPLAIAPSAFQPFHDMLDSTWAAWYAEGAGCSAWRATLDAGWAAALLPYLKAPSVTLLSFQYAGCGTALATSTFGLELAELAAHVSGSTATRLDYLLGYDYGEAASFATFEKLALEAPSLQLREEALLRLSYQAQGFYGYSSVVDTERWKVFFRDRLGQATSSARFLLVWDAVIALRDDQALAIAGQKLHTIAFTPEQAQGIACAAFALAPSGSAAWSAFQQAAEPWDSLPAGVQAYLEAPTACTR